MPTLLDHITVVAPTLADGDAWVQRQLGVRPQPGGAHPRMGTHNRVLRIGAAMFLEVIAIDPAAPKPPRPRWFEMDAPAARGPRLACWVARSEDARGALDQASEFLGVLEPMSRGALTWLLSIPEDGSLPFGGAAPAVIEWHAATHPARGLPDSGCRLLELALRHPQPQRLRDLLASLSFAEPGVAVTVRESFEPGLSARIETPDGVRTLGAGARSTAFSPRRSRAG